MTYIYVKNKEAQQKHAVNSRPIIQQSAISDLLADLFFDTKEIDTREIRINKCNSES